MQKFTSEKIKKILIWSLVLNFVLGITSIVYYFNYQQTNQDVYVRFLQNQMGIKYHLDTALKETNYDEKIKDLIYVRHRLSESIALIKTVKAPVELPHFYSYGGRLIDSAIVNYFNGGEYSEENMKPLEEYNRIVKEFTDSLDVVDLIQEGSIREIQKELEQQSNIITEYLKENTL